MSKSTFFTGQPIFNQLISLIPKHIISNASLKYNADRYCKKFMAYDHLVTMLYTSLEKCTSIREVTTGLLACFHKLNHLGLRNVPRRSTLSDANSRRSSLFFQNVYHELYNYYYRNSPDSLEEKDVKKRLFLVDSTTISLFNEVMKGMGTHAFNGRKKGGAKAHMIVKAENMVPEFVQITEAIKNDKDIFPFLKLAPGAIVVLDKGYNSYAQFHKWDQEQVIWVTRMAETAYQVLVDSRPLSSDEKSLGVIADDVVNLGRPSNKSTQSICARRIGFKDLTSGKKFNFITNDMKFKASTVANIYKQRWQIELLFKRLKQNYPLQYFLGDSENAITIQIWCALITDLLLNIIKRVLKRNWSYSNLRGMIRLHLMNYINLIDFLNSPEDSLNNYKEKMLELEPNLFSSS
ncbi:MAG: IS4 family transposase [Saprospiraceae bacterium]|nr:IS4 family transposase [Candidatus Vicinibacter affinis]MBK7302260.1 IS4 family transposase [Candidatus Vicinibacter affinis]